MEMVECCLYALAKFLTVRHFKPKFIHTPVGVHQKLTAMTTIV